MQPEIRVRRQDYYVAVRVRRAFTRFATEVLDIGECIDRADGKVWISAVIGALLIVQGALIFQIYWGSDLSVRFYGSASYRHIAENLVQKGFYSLDGVSATAYRQPLYPAVLATLMSMFGSNWIVAAIVLQSSIDIVIGCFIVTISLRIFQSRLGASLGALLYILHLSFHRESLTQRETVFFTLLLVVFLYLLIARRRDVVSYPALFLVAALAYLTRPTGFLLLSALLVVIAIERGALIKSSGTVISLLIGTLLFVVTIVPYHVYLYRQFAEISLIAPQTTNGVNLYHGNNPDTDRIYPHVDVDQFVPFIREILAREGIRGEFQTSEFLKAKAIDYIVKEPLTFLKRAVVKLGALYSPIATPLGSGTLTERAGKVVIGDFRSYLWSHGTLQSTLGIVNAVFVVIVLLGAAGCTLRRQTWQSRYRKQVMLILCPIVLVTLVHMVTFGETRHRLPLDPLLIILAGSYYSSKLQEWQQNRDR
jgi:hypothetical protein